MLPGLKILIKNW